MTDTITIRITKIKISTTIIASWTINSGKFSSSFSITEQREIVNQAAILISIYQTTILIVSVNQTSIIIINFRIIEQTTNILDWINQRLISRSIHQMKFVNKTLFTEKITTINFIKIIHRVIISIDFFISHTIIIIIALIVINFASRLFIKLISFFYLINSKEKTASWINQINRINQDWKRRAWKRACKSR